MEDKQKKVTVKKELVTEVDTESEALGQNEPSVENICPVCGHANCITKRICEVCSNLLF